MIAVQRVRYLVEISTLGRPTGVHSTFSPPIFQHASDLRPHFAKTERNKSPEMAAKTARTPEIDGRGIPAFPLAIIRL
jgi:hypothetical protein